MKKIFTLFLLFATLTAFSQGIGIKYDGVVIPDGGTIEVDAPRLNADNTYYFDIYNLSGQDLGIMFQRTNIEVVPGAVSTFCIGGSCLQGDASIFPEEIAAGDSLTYALDGEAAFHIQYNPHGSCGVSHYKFLLYDETDNSIKTEFFIKINSTDDIKEQANQTLFTAYPNPASDRVTIEYKLEVIPSHAQIVIRNIAGVQVFNAPANASGKMIISLDQFSSGIYFYALEADGRTMVTKKLIVK
ncbi:MAG TPA: T9SS type A sorting domain-containing protein [Bacteroidales bacterium]|nr:T9SS type A sorting domain-containing protein [Bacteroidales bacterium]HPZ02679.1 T9SS type A sorting domain-containing protein [Bacteroidales bacterium]HQB74421.1 T9SS type A sorting domain-containing protein [Bacteroidales bacterium]HQQ20979.1 T9SS type A sorting domain-containing protein [Bacteroidales bacterium]